MAKIGRNDPCPCGSGRKYKQCCAGKTGKLSVGSWVTIAALAAAAVVVLFFLYNLVKSDGTGIPTCPPGQVWSDAHNHCHAPGG